MLMPSKSPLWLIRTLVGLVSRFIFFNSFQVAGKNKKTFTLVARKIWMVVIDLPIKLNRDTSSLVPARHTE